MFTLHNGDCLEYMKSCKDNQYDYVITDPPYGKKPDGNYGQRKSIRYGRANKKAWLWDKRPSKEYFDEMFRVSKNQVIFGMNYFIDYLRPTNCFLVWDKKNGNSPYADCEIAWTSFTTTARKFDYFWLGAHIHRIEKIYHPTQKPTALMLWVIEKYTNENETILDPFMGSGTTIEAAERTGRNSIGIEKDEGIFQSAALRLKSFTPSNNRLHWTCASSRQS